MHKTLQGAAGTTVPRFDKFTSIISLRKNNTLDVARPHIQPKEPAKQSTCQGRLERSEFGKGRRVSLLNRVDKEALLRQALLQAGTDTLN